MLSSEPKQASTAAQATVPPSDASLTMELLELELSLDGFTTGAEGFVAHVRAAAAAIDGALLFELPASGLIADCDRIAVLRRPPEHKSLVDAVRELLLLDALQLDTALESVPDVVVPGTGRLGNDRPIR